MRDTGVRTNEWNGYGMQVKELEFPNKPNSNVNIGSAFACRCIRSDRTRSDQFENVGDGVIVGGTLDAEKRGSFGLIPAVKSWTHWSPPWQL